MDGHARVHRGEGMRTPRRCPDCGAPVASLSGCEACLFCGQSRCVG